MRKSGITDSPARQVLSLVLPEIKFFSFVRTNADPCANKQGHRHNGILKAQKTT